MKINIIKKSAGTKAIYSTCPWIMDVPPESEQK